MKTTNLTIIEAIQSGKPFRRSVYPTGWWYSQKGAAIVRNDGAHYNLDAVDILATDWEIKRDPLVIFVNVFDDNASIAGEAFFTPEAAWKRASDTKPRKFVEVIE